MTYTRGPDLSGTVAGVGGIGGLLARSHGYSGGNWSSHNFYHADGNGNVTALVNSAGTLQASYRYDPYGRWLAGGGALASANGLRFSSKPWVGFAGSPTSGLYSYGYRFYDPYLQRWVNRARWLKGKASIFMHLYTTLRYLTSTLMAYGDIGLVSGKYCGAKQLVSLAQLALFWR